MNDQCRPPHRAIDSPAKTKPPRNQPRQFPRPELPIKIRDLTRQNSRPGARESKGLVPRHLLRHIEDDKHSGVILLAACEWTVRSWMQRDTRGGCEPTDHNRVKKTAP
jgi:hypothetical protein